MCKTFKCLVSYTMTKPMSNHGYCFAVIFALLMLFTLGGCGNPDAAEHSASPQGPSEKPSGRSADVPQEDNAADRVSLLKRRLSEQESAEGWVHLFDGVTLFGWQSDSQANFRVEEGCIVVDQGEKSLLCTEMNWDHYELLIEYRAGETTNSGVFLSTSLSPGDITKDCYEVNIAP